MNVEIDKIDLSKMGGPLFSGREKGRLNREKFDLDTIDVSDKHVDVIIPDSTYSITSSFFMGLFGKSIRELGDRDKFLDKYRFKMPDKFRDKVERYIERALREKTPLI